MLFCKILLCLICVISICYIFINANPYALYSNKFNHINNIPNKYKPKTELYINKKLNYSYPFVLKPNKLSGKSLNVKLINNKKEETNYFKKNDKNNTIIQEFLDYKNEVGIYYIKNPLNKKGKIISITHNNNLGGKIFIREKCTNNFKNKTYLYSEKLNDIIDSISKKNNCNIGRYDIRYKNETEFKKNNFKIIELNISGSDGRAGAFTNCNIKAYIDYYYYMSISILNHIYIGLINIILLKFISLQSFKEAVYEIINLI